MDEMDLKELLDSSGSDGDSSYQRSEKGMESEKDRKERVRKRKESNRRARLNKIKPFPEHVGTRRDSRFPRRKRIEESKRREEENQDDDDDDNDSEQEEEEEDDEEEEVEDEETRKSKKVWLLRYHEKAQEIELTPGTYFLGRDDFDEPYETCTKLNIGIEDMKVSRTQIEMQVDEDRVACVCKGRNPLRYIADPSTSVQITKDEVFVWDEGGSVEMSYRRPGILKVTLSRPKEYLEKEAIREQKKRKMNEKALKERKKRKARKIEPLKFGSRPQKEDMSTDDMLKVVMKPLSPLPFDGKISQGNDEEEKKATNGEVQDNDESKEKVSVQEKDTKEQVPMDTTEPSNMLVGPFVRTSSANWVIQSDENGLERANRASSPRVSNMGSPSSGSPRSRMWDGKLQSGGDLSFKAAAFSWAGADPFHHPHNHEEEGDVSSEVAADKLLPGSRSHSPTFDHMETPRGTVRTADGFPFKRQSSRSSIMASDKHPSMVTSPRALKCRRTSVDEGSKGDTETGEEEKVNGRHHSTETEGARSPRTSSLAARTRRSSTLSAQDKSIEEHEVEKSAESDSGSEKPKRQSANAKADVDDAEVASVVDMETSGVSGGPDQSDTAQSGGKDDTILPRNGVGPRVGSDFQVELPSIISNARPLCKIVGEGKGSIGAWAKVFQTEPEPLAENADEREDTTRKWTEEEKLWFHKGMFEYLKDFHQIWRNIPIFRKNNKTPHDLIAYYYRRYKDTDDYRRWKVFVSEGDGQLPEGMVALDDSRSKAPAAVATLKEMIDAGLLTPGPNQLEVIDREQVVQATLLPDGLIECNGMEFDSVSNFSLYIKRLHNPGLKEDNGWTSVHYMGRTLAEIRDEAAAKRFPAASTMPGAVTASSNAMPVQNLPSTTAASIGRESRARRSSVMSSSGTGSGHGRAAVTTPASQALSSLPVGFSVQVKTAPTTRASVANATPVVTKHPWKVMDQQVSTTSRRGASRPNARSATVQRSAGFFTLHVESDSNDDSDDDETEEVGNGNLSPTGAGGSSSTSGNTSGSRSGKVVTLKKILDSGLIVAGEKVLRVRYKNKTFFADLREDGTIVDCKTKREHATPSLWTIEVKRSLNPNIRTDSGWYSIQYIPRLGSGASSNGGGAKKAGKPGREGQNKRHDDGEDQEDEADNDDEDKNDEEDEEEYQNLYTYRKMMLMHTEEKKAEERKEVFSILTEIERLRQNQDATTNPFSRHAPLSEIAERKYFYADALQSRLENTLGAKNDNESDAESGAGEAASSGDEIASRRSGSRAKKRRGSRGRRGGNNKRPKQVQYYCMCQKSSDEQYEDDEWFLQCTKGTGACNGWIHPRCFGLQMTQKEAEEFRDFVCPLCSADGIDLRMYSANRKIRDQATTYAPGTLVMTRIDFPRDNPIGWFPAKIVDVDFYNHPDRPYRIVYAMDPLLSEWIDLGPNDPTHMLAVDWSRSSCFLKQDNYWRKKAQSTVNRKK